MNGTRLNHLPTDQQRAAAESLRYAAETLRIKAEGAARIGVNVAISIEAIYMAPDEWDVPSEGTAVVRCYLDGQHEL